MKRIKYNLALLFAVVLLLGSCKDKFFDINVSPNDPAATTPELSLPSALAGSAYVMGGYYQALGGFWSQQYAQGPAATQWIDWESYNLTEDDFNRQFSTMYAGALMDYEYVRTNSKASANWSFYAISTLMQAYTFEVMADLYDKIPFTDALKGVNTLQPKYDDGSVVYDSLLARIDVAMGKDFTVSSSKNPGTADLIFGGNMAKWQKFANTLKLKMYLRYVNNIDPNKYKTQIQALLTQNNFLDEDAAFSAFKPDQTGYNPYFNTFVDRLAGNVIANKTLIDFLNASSDPRKEKLFTASVTGANYNGLATGDAKNHTNTIKDYCTPTVSNIAPVYFFTKEETLFLVAEAQARYTTAAAAETTFNAAVFASFVSLNLEGTAITYPYNGIKSIMEQKWIAATNKRGIEAFFDYNRTGYPEFFSVSLTSVLNGTERPKRLFFPGSERKTNSNTPAKVALTVKVWWAK